MTLRYFNSISIILLLSACLLATPQHEQPLWPAVTKNDSIHWQWAVSTLAIGASKCTMTEDDLELYAIYVDFNARYFKGKLPAKLCIKWSDVLDLRGYAGTTYKDEATGLFYIDVSTTLKPWPRVTKLTVAHEMSHTKCWETPDEHRLEDAGGRHNTCFQTTMKFLANSDAFRDTW